MQIAVGAVLFVLGFSFATLLTSRPRRILSSLSQCFVRFDTKIRYSKTLSLSDDLEKTSFLKHVFPENPDEGTSLLTKSDIEEKYDTSTWQRLAYEEFKDTILARGAGLKTFPCIYATLGYRSNDHRYIFLESENPSEPRNIRLLAPALRAYLRISHNLGPNTSLVIMAAPSEIQKSVEDYNDSFWQMLRGLRIWDPKPWPRDVPQNTAADKWTFCFDGTPLFPVALTPAHSQRWSRHAPVPLIALQPKWVLDNLLSTPEKRASATGKVRKLLKEYDQIDISPDLTSYGTPGTSEVHQLCLLDENKTAPCPYKDFDK